MSDEHQVINESYMPESVKLILRPKLGPPNLPIFMRIQILCDKLLTYETVFQKRPDVLKNDRTKMRI